MTHPPEMVDHRSRLLEFAARSLADARTTGERIALLTATIDGLSPDEAYAIARRSFALHGEPVAGYKLGYTNAAIREQMGIFEPNYGRYAASALREVRDGAARIEGVVHPRLEPEITVILKNPLRGPDVSAADVLAAIGSAHLSFEVVDTRYREYNFTLCDNIADGSSGAFCILGEAISLEDLAASTSLAVTLFCGEEQIDQAVVDDVLTGIGENIAMMVKRLSNEGEALEPGCFVMSGALTRAHPLNFNVPYRAELAGLGTISCVMEREQHP